MYSLLLSRSGGVSWDQGYFLQAWNNFIYVVNWMKNTDILTLGDITFNFWNVCIGLLAFGIIADFILRLFWGD